MSPTTPHHYYLLNLTYTYLLNLTYTRPLDEVNVHLDAHSRYLESAYERGIFLLSGRKEHWTGGIILARATSLEEIQQVIAEDPY